MSVSSSNNARTIVVMHGDQTGEELLQEALRVLAPPVIGMELDFQHFDLSLANRRATRNEVVREAAAAMLQSGLGMKAATITPPDPNDVGSPNALLREAINGAVILRTGRRISRVRPVGGVRWTSDVRSRSRPSFRFDRCSCSPREPIRYPMTSR